ncbi:cysteine dioxygenase [Peribacillus butanolivorans]|uniref:cysteine dioxygenase family protein n=1 Tax=Peribacillus butanolivorans TaxID=421767 RepID=UPI00362D8590
MLNSYMKAKTLKKLSIIGGHCIMTKQTKDYTLIDFIRDMTWVIEKTESNAVRVEEAERLLGELLRTTSWFPPEKRKPSSEGYARHSLYCDPHDRFEIMALVWKPGQKTSLHDHDGTWGAEGVVAGKIKVTNYLRVEEISENLVKLQQTDTLIVNQQMTCKLLPPADCHILETEGDQTVITIHVYGKQLRKFRVFKPLQKEGIFSAHDYNVGYTPELI